MMLIFPRHQMARIGIGHDAGGRAPRGKMADDLAQSVQLRRACAPIQHMRPVDQNPFRPCGLAPKQGAQQQEKTGLRTRPAAKDPTLPAASQQRRNPMYLSEQVSTAKPDPLCLSADQKARAWQHSFRTSTLSGVCQVLGKVRAAPDGQCLRRWPQGLSLSRKETVKPLILMHEKRSCVGTADKGRLT